MDRSMRRTGSLVVSILVLVLGLVACAGPLASAPPGASDDGPGAPPAAIAAVEGGDPVIAQLGTYTWGSTGSDSPWLPGSPITVGAGESLSVAFDPASDVESWTARFVPRAQDGPAGAVTLGQGQSPIRFAVPPPGRWTVELAVVFPDGRGSASYAWAVDVE